MIEKPLLFHESAQSRDEEEGEKRGQDMRGKTDALFESRKKSAFPDFSYGAEELFPFFFFLK